MDVPETLQALVAQLGQSGDRVALIQLRRHRREDWTYQHLAEQTARLAAGLSARGLAPGDRVILLAPSSPRWIIACLALLEMGAIPVPVDSQAMGEDLATILATSGARWAFTTASLIERIEETRPGEQLHLLRLDDEEEAEGGGELFGQLLATPASEPPRVDPSSEAVLFYTSGTSGRPKGVPLTHANLLNSLAATLGEKIVAPSDRLLQPLPLHHVYPFALGTLAPLVLGIPIILPYSLTGPQLVRALNEGQATAILGIPRLYTALYAAIERRVAAGGPVAGTLFKGLLGLSVFLSQRSRWRPGEHLFSPLRRRFAPELRLLISGGAALPGELAWQLDGLGWQVASGYGLTETSPILTINPPESRRYASAGRAPPAIELRIAPPEEGASDGEVQAKGLNVFGGYLDLPDKTTEAFTEDGWYRTGDLGLLDEEGWLYLRGRASSRIVLPGGENVDPEAVERRLEGCPAVAEVAVLDQDGRLAALVVPTPEAARSYEGEALEQQIRKEVTEASRGAPSHQRIGVVRVASSPLPRTRLGKLRRHLLAERFQASAQQRKAPPKTGLAPPEALSPPDRQLLEDPIAARVWTWLGERFKGHWITPDTSLQLDLEVDSLEWISLTMDLQGRLGLALEEEAIGRIETVRDLLQETAAASEVSTAGGDIEERLRDPETQLNDRQLRWLTPPSGVHQMLGALLHSLTKWAMRRIFRLQVDGAEHIPHEGPCLVTPNHLSALDPMAILACLDSAQRHTTYWGGWTGILFHRPWTRLMSRALQVLPVDPRAAPISSLAFGAAALKRGGILVWFPEGSRSKEGSLQPFRPGVSTLARAYSARIVPAHIKGTGHALPPGSWRLRRCPVRVRFGAPLDIAELESEGHGETPAERLANALHDRVQALGEENDDDLH